MDCETSSVLVASMDCLDGVISLTLRYILASRCTFSCRCERLPLPADSLNLAPRTDQKTDHYSHYPIWCTLLSGFDI